MKISAFTCLQTTSQSKGRRFRRVKITVSSREGTFRIYLFKGGEHAVCNHKDCAMDADKGQTFRALYGDIFGRATL